MQEDYILLRSLPHIGLDDEVELELVAVICDEDTNHDLVIGKSGFNFFQTWSYNPNHHVRIPIRLVDFIRLNYDQDETQIYTSPGFNGGEQYPTIRQADPIEIRLYNTLEARTLVAQIHSKNIQLFEVDK